MPNAAEKKTEPRPRKGMEVQIEVQDSAAQKSS